MDEHEQDYVEFNIYKGRGDDAVIIAVGKLSKEDAHLTAFNFHLNHGYPKFYKDGRNWTLHRYIMGANPNDNSIIDHINGNKLDARRENLRSVTTSLNNHNREYKSIHGKYRGTSKSTNCWYTIFEHKKQARCPTEVEAAACYNLLARNKYGEHALLNSADIVYDTIPEQFALKTRAIKGSGSVHFTVSNKFRATFSNVYLGFFDTEAEARHAIQLHKNNIEKEEVMIKRNVDGHAILDCRGSKIIVDDDTFKKYHDSKLNFSRAGYVQKGNKRLHRLIMNAGPGDIVDHINSNLNDLRRSSLRFVTVAQNTQNRVKQLNTSSKYRGVSKLKKRRVKIWCAQVRISATKRITKYFADEIDAAKFYDENVVKYYGPGARLNFPNTTIF